MTQPSGLKNLLRAAAGALPVVPRTDQLPNRTVTVEELPIDPANVAAYAAVTGLRYGNQVPLTYPFALTFPSVMSLVTGFDFPFAAMGAIHTENHITQYRPIAVTDAVGVRVRAENLREHRRGLLVDLVTNVSVGNDVAWHQVTTFLHQQRTSLSGEPKPPPQKSPSYPRPPRSCGSPRRRSAAMPPSAAITTRSTPTRSRRNCSASPPSSRTGCSLPRRYWRISKPVFRTRCAIRFGSPSRCCCRPPRDSTSPKAMAAGISRCAIWPRDTPPDRYRAGSIAGATRIGPAWSAIRRYRVPHA